MFQGVWLMVMGFMLWTPTLIPKGCFMNLEEGHKVVRCHGEEALERAKSLVNIQFSWYVIGVTIFTMTFYLVMIKLYFEKVEYKPLAKFESQDQENDNNNNNDDDVEAQKKGNNEKIGESRRFLQIGKTFGPMDIERWRRRKVAAPATTQSRLAVPLIYGTVAIDD
ncbi:hypothetical protein Salat_0437700 [Sesamum alatum]|uniref:Uncharacterized protein n=1 Tax=Sesamum alatum TaxID=300844 RepID=A0AAE1Z421_9LAMI|nr:hypothetical protein Salat_0437700 [Sesamum alatum]